MSARVIFALTCSRIALAMVLVALTLTPLAARRSSPHSPLRRLPMAIATLALGLAVFALFYGLVFACDRL